MITRILLATALAGGLMVSAANALTVVNTDKSPRQVEFTPKGGHMHRYTLAAHHQRSIDCKNGGTLALGKSSQSCDAKTAKISIRHGKFVI